MKFNRIYYEVLGVRAEIAKYAPEGKTREGHVMLHVQANGETFFGRLERLIEAETALMEDSSLAGMSVIYKRYFCSDAANQAELIPKSDSCATGIVQQPPLDGSKIAVWIYMQDAGEVELEQKDGIAGKTLVVRNNGYEHLWNMGMITAEGNSYEQTSALLEAYEANLDSHNLNIADNCIRTWFFVRDVDIQYSGMVSARKENFLQHGLTKDTHYISSTGICGVPPLTGGIIMLEAYALKNFQANQQSYLYAPTHLNPTIEYGVTFERGTRLDFGDRKHIYISGTASIDNKGEVVHIGDIKRQTLRMWENVEKLLEEGGACFGDVAQIIVYIRDIADYKIVSDMFRERFPDTPFVITAAPVCRPTWLIEMECIAISHNDNTEYRDF